MSALCCAVVVGGGDALSPMRIRVPAEAEAGLSGDDEAVTTPEASTDSENSSFESDEDEHDGSSGSGRKSPARPARRVWPGCNGGGEGKKQLQQPQTQNPQPLRKVRFTLHDNNDQHNRRVSGALYRQGVGRPGRAATIRDDALADVGMMRPVDTARQQRQQGAKLFPNAPNQRIEKSTATTASSNTTTTSESETANSTDGGVRRAWKKRVVVAAPFKSTSTNISTNTNIGKSASTGASSSSLSAAAAPAPARAPFHGTAYPTTTTTTTTTTIPPTPASPKKRKVSASSSSSRKRGDGTTRPSRGAVAAAAAVVVQRVAAPASKLLVEKAAAAAAVAAAPGAQPMDLCEVEEEPDLTCKEELELSREGEMRTPICRFLLPCWPEGVEGYEEAGGWRRVGGSHTRENFPRGRRCI